MNTLYHKVMTRIHSFFDFIPYVLVKVCVDEQREQCSTEYNRECSTEYKEQCSTEYSTSCAEEYTQECRQWEVG